MRVAVVMTYYKREHQLKRTLRSIGESKCDSFGVVVVDDVSEDGLVMPDVSFPCDLLTIKKQEKTWQNPEPAYNLGIIRAIELYKPDVMVIQNAECIHIGDVISYAAEHIDNSTYTPFKCLALDEKTTFDESIELLPLTQSVKHGASREGELAWYNHPVYRPCNLEFACAITTENVITLNGYDERFIYGVSYGDNYWKHRIELLGLNFVVPDSPVVAHQWHFYPWYWEKMTAARSNTNATLYNRVITEGRVKAEHLITKDFESIAY